MKAIQIEADSRGAHAYQESDDYFPLLDGWALIPDDMDIPDTFPFVGITVEEIKGVMVAVSMTAGVVPPPEPITPEPTIEDDLLETALDHEVRLLELELLGGEG